MDEQKGTTIKIGNAEDCLKRQMDGVNELKRLFNTPNGLNLPIKDMKFSIKDNISMISGNVEILELSSHKKVSPILLGSYDLGFSADNFLTEPKSMNDIECLLYARIMEQLVSMVKREKEEK